MIKDNYISLIISVEQLPNKDYNNVNSNNNPCKVSLNFDSYIKEDKYCFLGKHKSLLQRSLKSVIQEGYKMVSQYCFKILIKFHQLQLFFPGQGWY